jgi:hypothetical protein
LTMPDLVLLLVKAMLVTAFYHVIKKVVLWNIKGKNNWYKDYYIYIV